MGYSKANGRWANTEPVTLDQGVTPHTATFQSAAFELGDRGTMCLDLTTTAIAGTGTPTATCAIETSKDGTTWRALASFTAQTALNATERKSFTGCDRFVRMNVTISGTTPSFTLTCNGEAK